VTSQPTETLKVLVYSDDVDTREQVILALGKRPHPDLPELEYVEVATEPVVIQQMDLGGIALAILDGEATPAGGMGIARQLKDEIYRCPPILVLTGRVQDNWLAAWSLADNALPHPLDPALVACSGHATHAGSAERAAMRSRYHPKLALGSRCCVS